MTSRFLSMQLNLSQFSSLDFDQAMIHVKGMWMVIAARGGISTLQANQDLMLMISWYGSATRILCSFTRLRCMNTKKSRRVDITAALLHDTNPMFPLSANMTSASVFHRPGLEMLPAPLISVTNDENTQDMRFTRVMSCIGDLNALAALLRVELATKGDAIWDDEEQMGLLMNPATHHLLDQQQTRSSEPTTRCDVLSEALRLGAIIWIIRVKRRCCSYPGTAKARISTLLKMLSRTFDMVHVWNSSTDLQTVRLWLLVLCSISEPNDQDDADLMRMIASDMKDQRSVSWEGIMSTIRRMPWIDIFEPPCAKLGQRLVKDYL